jgi:hypothetical protein
MDLFNEKNQGPASPEMLPANNQGGPDLTNYRYRIGFFTLSNSAEGSDDITAYETLLNRSVSADQEVMILERKDSISTATGVYTVVVTYLERQGE